ncbi:putative sugar nucleotidyl transferase [Niabella beijingensis]|uniref:putative sugar nucleotidyl transferase n=1 Tax=Niabella beijingensis TaxID=2872700 RepID=UPI001CBB4C10|nr:putative sugar nucleotidyl transferase [Niabella beijingensis]MBZ4191210.1 sugar-1-phosphate guanyl transferase [Niabella beijingensis]
MRAVIFTHKQYRAELLFPFSLTTAVEEMPAGMLTNRRRWELIAATALKSDPNACWHIPAHLVPSEAVVSLLNTLSPGASLQFENGAVAGYGSMDTVFDGGAAVPAGTASFLEYSWDIFERNVALLQFDFSLLTAGRRSAPLREGNRCTNEAAVFIEEGADVRFSIINAEEGPVYISKNALVMEGTCIRGPVFIGENAVVKMGSKIYGGTTIGHDCTVGGEIKNSVFFPFSNKGHDGYVGDSVIGHWCNLGGGTTTSNMKNTAGRIRIELPTGAVKAGTKCGVLMGDYSRAAINSSFNTGTVTGICSNIFGNGLTPKWIPSFSWGYDTAIAYDLENALAHLERWMQTKKQVLTDTERNLITHIYNQQKQRNHETANSSG